MHAQIILHPEGLVAHGAGVRPLPSVHHPMFAESRAGDKTLLTVVTLVGPLAAMVAPVLEQRRVGRERLGAGLALKTAIKNKCFRSGDAPPPSCLHGLK